jgi:hypothetical protein
MNYGRNTMGLVVGYMQRHISGEKSFDLGVLYDKGVVI